MTNTMNYPHSKSSSFSANKIVSLLSPLECSHRSPKQFTHSHTHSQNQTLDNSIICHPPRATVSYQSGVCASQVCTSVGQTVCSPLDAARCPRQHSAKSTTDRTAVPVVSRCADGARNWPPSSDTTTVSIDCSGCAIARQLSSALLTSTTTRHSGR